MSFEDVHSILQKFENFKAGDLSLAPTPDREFIHERDENESEDRTGILHELKY